MKRQVTITLRLDKKYIEFLDAYAESEQRSRNSTVVFLLESIFREAKANPEHWAAEFIPKPRPPVTR